MNNDDEMLRDSTGTNTQIERGYLVGVSLRRGRSLLTIEDSLNELAQLAATASIEIVGQASQRLDQPNPATFIGSGKIEEIQEHLEALEVDVIIFDDELSPRHQRELEKAFGEDIKVIDRSALILDIFARHAQTREGALQVELAQYEYRLPRLTRQWTHLARQAGGGSSRAGGGGVGLRGPGETQLEVDRREISRRIARLKKDLEAVRAHRGRHRQQRRQANTPVAALVGYTNAGKSTLLNHITGADVYAANQLFATLDPITRRMALPGGKTILLSDTVGFIQKLPTTLIAAFRATLEEIAEASVLVHVADASHPNVLEQIIAVEDTLDDLDLPPIPRVLVLNKIDQVEEDDLQQLMEQTHDRYGVVLPISALTGEGIPEFIQAVEDQLRDEMILLHVLVPYAHGDIIARIHEQGIILSEDHTAEGVVVKAQVPPQLSAQVIAVEAVSDVSD